MILDSPFPPDPRVENEALALINAGHEVTIFCLTYSESIPMSMEYKGIHVIRMKVNRFYRSISALAYTIPFYHYLLKKKLSQVFDPADYEAVHIHDIQSARSVFDLVEGIPIKKVLDLHENRPEIMKYYEHVNSFLGKRLINPSKWKFFERQYINRSDAVIVVTESAKKYYKQIYDEEDSKFVVVPNSVTESFYQNRIIDEAVVEKYTNRFVVLYLGNTGERRGIEEAIEAIYLLKDDIPEIMFLCVGSSKSDEKWNMLVHNYNLENHVHMLGWQDFEKFPTFLKAGDIGISPLHKNIHHDTTYANKLFQYQAFKLPLVVSDCDAQADVVNNSICGFVHEERNVNDLADKIKRLAKDEKLRKEMGENGYQALREKYSWERVSKQLITIYDA